MKIVAAVLGSLLVAGGAGGYMFLNCPSRCCPSQGDAVVSQPAALPAAAVAAPATGQPAMMGCPVTEDCNGPGCEPVAKSACCEEEKTSCCPSEKAGNTSQ